MKFSGKMCLMIILKVTKNQGFTLSLEDTLIHQTCNGTFMKPFDLINTIPLTRTKTLVNNLLMSKVYR